jgi:hypothetical protein
VLPSQRKRTPRPRSETLLPDRPISTNPNLVTETGLKALEFQLRQAREAYEVAQTAEDVNERRRLAAIPLRDARYFAERLRTAQVVPDPISANVVVFGSTVPLHRMSSTRLAAPQSSSVLQALFTLPVRAFRRSVAYIVALLLGTLVVAAVPWISIGFL